MGKHTVFVVDDSKLSYKKVVDALVGSNFEVVDSAKTGFDAVERYKVCKSELVTMDMSLPDMNGIECSKSILEINPQAKIVMISAMHDEKLLVQGRSAGIKFFLQKPFNDQELISTLKKLSNEEIVSDSDMETYVRPFVRIFKESLQLLSGVDSDVSIEEVKEECLMINGMASVISLIGSPLKKVILYTDFETSRKFARKILNTAPDEPDPTDDDVIDSMEELANIIAGRTSSYINNSLKDHEIRLIPLGTLYGEEMKIINSKLCSYNIRSVSDFGEFNLNIAVVGGE